MPIRLFAFLLAFLLAGAAISQSKQRVDKAADLPRFSYRIDGKVEDLVRDDAKFRAFAAQVKRDFESVLARYEIPDYAVERGYLVTLAQIDYLDGNYDAALARLERMKALEQKPADKLLSGFTMRTLIGAERKAGGRGSDAYRQEVARQVRAGLDAMPYAVVQNGVRQMKAGAEIVSEPLVINVSPPLLPLRSFHL